VPKEPRSREQKHLSPHYGREDLRAHPPSFGIDKYPTVKRTELETNAVALAALHIHLVVLLFRTGGVVSAWINGSNFGDFLADVFDALVQLGGCLPKRADH
jgi:hypothetical protein